MHVVRLVVAWDPAPVARTVVIPLPPVEEQMKPHPLVTAPEQAMSILVDGILSVAVPEPAMESAAAGVEWWPEGLHLDSAQNPGPPTQGRRVP